MKKIAYSLSAALLALTIMPWQTSTASAAEPAAPVTPLTNEITVQTEANFRNADDVNSFIIKAARNHVSVINMSVKQDSDVNGNSGFAFYDSQIVPEAIEYESFDALAAVIDKAHEYGIKVRAWVPQAQDKAAIDINSSWQMRTIDDYGKISSYTGYTGTENHVNLFEPAVQQYERSIVKEVVQNYNIDGVVVSGLDFDNERVDMNISTINAFRQSNSFDPREIDFTRSSSASKIAQWNNWKAQQMASYLQSISTDVKTIKPDLALGVYTASPDKANSGQDVALFSQYVDFLLPMANYSGLGHSVDWIYNSTGILAATKAKAADKTLIPAVDANIDTNTATNLYNGLRTNQPGVTSVNYYGIGQWTDAMLNNLGLRSSL
ncbi:family 10 glycosylhydrolase [Paenibacillus wulumuqiensis]|uniref:family 10 glycosylhydrolase n=1 Tax=Paenibacillus wulumuqiensis TaxID=1567107 RepID=UPI00061A062D|nr:family 10 glycosylhydrolase [Paenibacillus wulumuqiensis]